MLSLTFLAVPATIADTDRSAHVPLFPVSIDETLPDPGATFDEVRELILKRYYSTTISDEALYFAAIKGMLSHVAPADRKNLSALWSPATYHRVLDNLKGVQVSIGIRSKFDPTDGSLTVSEVLENSSAIGRLKIMDRILRINGIPLRGKTISELDEMLQGDAGTMVALTVIRDIELIEIQLTREKFALTNVGMLRLPSDVALVSVKKVSANVSVQGKEIMNELQAANIENVIFDLRGNSGGLFLEGLRLAEIFLPGKAILLRTLKNPDKIENYVSSNPAPMQGFNIVILMNKSTASSSEIFATAMRAHGAAQLVGTSTYSKATLEETFLLANGFRTKFIIGAMYDPRGRSWHKAGVSPDFYIEQPPELFEKLAAEPPKIRLDKDLQLSAAWRLLTEQKATR